MNRWKSRPDKIGFNEVAKRYVEKTRDRFGSVYLLDIGFGKGDHFIEYSQGADLPVGIEPSKGEYYGVNIAAAKHNLKEANRKGVVLIQAVAEEMPFREGFFDMVTNRYSTQNPRALKEITRVLSKNGYYVKSGRALYDEALKALAKAFPNVANDEQRKRIGSRFLQPSIRDGSLESYINEVRNAGFNVFENECKEERFDENGLEGDKDIIDFLRIPHILGEKFDPEKDSTFINVVKGALRYKNGLYIGTGIESLVVAEKL
jgi:ubiquinone/menaquinone biosynthesis C-methylase UbiE